MPFAYLDHAASTPMRPEARHAMVSVLEQVHANPSGSHGLAREARRRLDDARDLVATVVGCHPGEVVFTSGGTEADDLAITGSVRATGGVPVASAIEHAAVLAPVRRAGGTLVEVDRTGRVDLDALADQLSGAVTDRPDGGPPVSVVSVMAANNETGVTQDLAAVAEILDRHAPHAALHTDAVAAAPWLNLSVAAAPAQLITLSGHKVGGPKGIGVLVVRDGTPLEAVLPGGGQERERRGGTPDVAGAVAMAAALAVTAAEREAEVVRVEALRRELVEGLGRVVPDLVVVSPHERERRTPGIVNVAIPGVEREALLFLLDEAGVAASWGSSCSSGATEPSHVHAALGLDPDLARGALRLSLGWTTTADEIHRTVEAVGAAVGRLRSGSSGSGSSGSGSSGVPSRVRPSGVAS